MKYDIILEGVKQGSESQVIQLLLDLFPNLERDKAERIIKGSNIPFVLNKLPDETEIIMMRLTESGAYVKAVVSPQDSPLLFPQGKLHTSPQTDEFYNRWYSEELFGLSEQSLIEWAISENAYEVYRFTFLPSFDPPIAIRVWIPTEQTQWGYMEFKIGSGQGGYHPGYVRMQGMRPLSDEEFDTVKLAMQSYRFWISVSWCTVAPGYAVLDGEEYIFEGIKDGQYKVLTDQSPSDGAAYEVAMVLFALLPEELRPSL